MKKTAILFFILCSLLLTEKSLAQQKSSKDAMTALAFIIGDWVGTSKTLQDGQVTGSIPAYEKIAYALDSAIITIDLYSEKLKLHTVIYFDEEKQQYSYNPYYEKGNASYSAKLQAGRLIVMPNESKRFIFMRDEKGRFIEYGEEKKGGKWEKYFEDVFKSM